MRTTESIDRLCTPFITITIEMLRTRRCDQWFALTRLSSRTRTERVENMRASSRRCTVPVKLTRVAVRPVSHACSPVLPGERVLVRRKKIHLCVRRAVLEQIIFPAIHAAFPTLALPRGLTWHQFVWSAKAQAVKLAIARVEVTEIAESFRLLAFAIVGAVRVVAAKVVRTAVWPVDVICRWFPQPSELIAVRRVVENEVIALSCSIT